MRTVEYIGWLLCLATIMIVVGAVTKSLIAFIWTEGTKGRHAGSEEAIRLMFEELAQFFVLLVRRWMATLCAVIVYLLTRNAGVSFFSGLGFFAMTFVIAGLMTPTVMLQIKAKAAIDSLIKSFKQKN